MVKWYDRAKGFGFLVRDNGLFEIYFREPVLTAAGLAILVPGLPDACETAPPTAPNRVRTQLCSATW